MVLEHKCDAREMSLRESLLSPEELAQNLALSPATLADWRTQGKGPAYLKTGRRVWYPKGHVEKWMQTQVRETNYDTEESRRHLALPLQARRQGIQRNNRLGRHKTKRDESSRSRSGAPERTSGGTAITAGFSFGSSMMRPPNFCSGLRSSTASTRTVIAGSPQVLRAQSGSSGGSR